MHVFYTPDIASNLELPEEEGHGFTGFAPFHRR